MIDDHVVIDMHMASIIATKLKLVGAGWFFSLSQ